MRPIFIIGYMGCGKTTFGRALATATGLRFIDLDELIEQRFDASVKEIFARYGEEGFRRMERETLQEAAKCHDTIVSCGGGTPCFFDNISHMNSRGLTIWLQASHECLFSRLTLNRDNRPLLANRSDDEIREIITRQLQARTPFYSRAAMTWQGDYLDDRQQIDANISDFLSAHPMSELQKEC